MGNMYLIDNIREYNYEIYRISKKGWEYKSIESGL